MTQRELLMEHDRRLSQIDDDLRDFRDDVSREFGTLRLELAGDRLKTAERFAKIEARVAQGVTILAVALFIANILGPVIANTVLGGG